VHKGTETKLVINACSPTLRGKGFQLIWPCQPLAILCSFQIVKQMSSCCEVRCSCLLLVGVCFQLINEMEIARLMGQLLIAEVKASLRETTSTQLACFERGPAATKTLHYYHIWWQLSSVSQWYYCDSNILRGLVSGVVLSSLTHSLLRLTSEGRPPQRAILRHDHSESIVHPWSSSTCCIQVFLGRPGGRFQSGAGHLPCKRLTQCWRILWAGTSGGRWQIEQ